MAVTKKRRATGTTKSTAKRKKAPTRKTVSATGPKKKTIGGLKYDPQGCFTTKSAAKKSAETLRAKGKKVRVIPAKKGTGACIYVR